MKKKDVLIQRQIWDKSAERLFNEYPHRRLLGSEGLDLLPEEKELSYSAWHDIEKYS
jgi:hypothetical protein